MYPYCTSGEADRVSRDSGYSVRWSSLVDHSCGCISWNLNAGSPGSLTVEGKYKTWRLTTSLAICSYCVVFLVEFHTNI